MQSGFKIPHPDQYQHQHQPQIVAPPENSCTALLLSMNQTHNILEQIHGGTTTTTHQLFLNQPLLFPPHHLYAGGGGGAPPPPSFFPPVSFKLGLNEVSYDNKDGLVRGSEQYEAVPEEARQSCLGLMPHCWQNQQDFDIKQHHQQQPFREPQASNENTDMVDRQENTEIATCLDSKSRAIFGELEAVYRRLETGGSNRTGPCENVRAVTSFDHGCSEASIGEDQEASGSKKIEKRKKRNKKRNYDHLEEFFAGLVKKMMDNQEKFQKRFVEVVERFDQTRRERDEAWRSHELARFEKEAEERARDKASAASREATIVECLERIMGQRVGLPLLRNPTDFPGSVMEVEKTRES